MFHRIQLQDWHNLLSMLSFLLFFTSFLIALFRAFSMTKKEVNKLENLPLDLKQTPHE